MTRWAMIADIDRCVGCQTCTAACRHANATSPAVEWRRVLDIEAGSFPNVSRTFVPVGCQHCAEAPCTDVCPTRATYRRDDGIVVMDYDLCIGCAYCEVACPYQARFKIDAQGFAYGGGAMRHEKQREEPRRLGVAQKCTFCSDRIDFGLANGLTPGRDPLASPACVNACIADALQFGDVDDPDSNVSRLLREQQHFRMHEELGTEPGFYYVHGPAGPPDTSAAPAAAVEPVTAGQIRARGVEPTHQKHWDWKAAGNFMCGGAGSGLLVFAAAATLAGAPAWLALAGGAALMALGLFCVLLKIGRPLRAANVLRQPRRSWMAREAWVAMAFFPLAALALWTQHSLVVIVAAALALIFLACQGMILFAAKGIPAWRAPLIVPLTVATGLAEGGGLLLAAVVVMSLSGPIVEATAIAVILLAAARGWTWRLYVRSLEQTGAPTRTLEVFERMRTWIHSLGLALPAALILVGFIPSVDARLPFALGGLVAFAAGWLLKYMLVTRAAWNQGFALARIPRGRGIAGQSVKPGWSLP
jgi:Fe-S-cluster-containing dehydrogenase component/DMSO reductase anchor subunit